MAKNYANVLSNRIDNIYGYDSVVDMNTKTFKRSLKIIRPYEDLLEGKRKLKDMAEYGYDKTDYQAMRVFRYNLMKNSLKVNSRIDLFIGLLNIISFYQIIVFSTLNIEFLYNFFTWIARGPIQDTALFNIPVLSNINFFIAFSIFYFLVIMIDNFKTSIRSFTRREFYYGDINLFFTKGQFGLHTLLFLSYIFDLVMYYDYIDGTFAFGYFKLIYSIAGVLIASISLVAVSRHLKYLTSLFRKIEQVVINNGTTQPTPITEELIQKHKYMVYNKKTQFNNNVQNKHIDHKSTTISKSSNTNIIEITPEHIIKKRQQEIQKDLFKSQTNESKSVKNEKPEENKVININKVKRRARM